MPHAYTEDQLVEHPAIARVDGHLLLPKPILGEEDAFALDIEKGEKAA